jgi:hypothetical protein
MKEKEKSGEFTIPLVGPAAFNGFELSPFVQGILRLSQARELR